MRVCCSASLSNFKCLHISKFLWSSFQKHPHFWALDWVNTGHLPFPLLLMPLMFFSSSFPSCFLCLVLVVVSFFCESVSSNCCLPLSYFCHVPISGSSRCLASMVVWVTSCFTWLGPCTFSFTSPVSFVRFCSAVFSTCCLFLCYLVCVYIISISFCSLSQSLLWV